MTIAARTAVTPLDLAVPLREAVWNVDRDQPVYRVRNMDQVIYERVKGPLVAAQVMGSVSILALVLAAVGIYGVVGYSVSQRTGEIGIRMALGARRSSIFHMILKQGLLLVALGLAIGLAAAFLSLRVLGSILYGISASDPATYAALSLVLLAVALVASFLPARRATRVDPLVALRYE
jgi:putative ABC transport system permease protein